MNGLVVYSLQKTSNNSDPFDVDPKTGKIVVVESTPVPGKHILFVEAADQPSNPSEKRTSLAVVTVDVKNHKGFFLHPIKITIKLTDLFFFLRR